MSTLTYLDADAIRAALSPADAVDAIARTLVGGFDPADDVPRTSAHLSHGHFLLMPTEAGPVAGIKVATVAPDNPSRGLPRIQASYLLYDAETLALKAVLDGTALTTLRTPAVSVAAVRSLLERFTEPLRIVVFGAGPQAFGHFDTLAAISPDSIGSATFVLRHPENAGQEIRARGAIVATGTEAASSALAAADVVVCATSARTPLFPCGAVTNRAVVIAVGSHEPNARELDCDLLARSTVIVEDPTAALREAGDVIIAVDEMALASEALVPMKDVVTGAFQPPSDRPVVFKSVGMSWQDLSIAHAVFARQT
ncbi:ornithine cyclodeaminase family protein [Microbacterium sp. NPDC058342]|uniref:ornithine cyclodeaminase family protein n=1 Tax=Microbacterium sp. NPDC058342 TaxID=3346454 RepID=UPI00365B00DF